MRRVDVLIVLSFLTATLALAPFIHIHIADNLGPLSSIDGSATPVQHAHFPGGHREFPAEKGRHADLDHDSPGTRSFALLAVPTGKAYRNNVAFAPVARASAYIQLAPIGLAPSFVTTEIHDPPINRLCAFRAPPAAASY